MKKVHLERAWVEIPGLPKFPVDNITLEIEQGLANWELLDIENFNEEDPAVSDIDDFIVKAQSRLKRYKKEVSRLLEEVRRLKS